MRRIRKRHNHLGSIAESLAEIHFGRDIGLLDKDIRNHLHKAAGTIYRSGWSIAEITKAEETMASLKT